MRYSVLLLLNLYAFLIYPIGCSNEIKTEDKQISINKIHEERITDICPNPGLVGGEEVGPNTHYIRIHQCFLNEKGWIERIDYYVYNPCRGPHCINAKVYYTYYKESYKTCHWSWDDYDQTYIISGPCNFYVFEF